MKENIELDFNRINKSYPQMSRSPDRINLIGAHTDDHLLILMNSGVKHSLASTKYSIMPREFRRMKSAHSGEGLVQVTIRIDKTRK